MTGIPRPSPTYRRLEPANPAPPNATRIDSDSLHLDGSDPDLLRETPAPPQYPTMNIDHHYHSDSVHFYSVISPQPNATYNSVSDTYNSVPGHPGQAYAPEVPHLLPYQGQASPREAPWFYPNPGQAVTPETPWFYPNPGQAVTPEAPQLRQYPEYQVNHPTDAWHSMIMPPPPAPENNDALGRWVSGVVHSDPSAQHSRAMPVAPGPVSRTEPPPHGAPQQRLAPSATLPNNYNLAIPTDQNPTPEAAKSLAKARKARNVMMDRKYAQLNRNRKSDKLQELDQALNELQRISEEQVAQINELDPDHTFPNRPGPATDPPLRFSQAKTDKEITEVLSRFSEFAPEQIQSLSRIRRTENLIKYGKGKRMKRKDPESERLYNRFTSRESRANATLIQRKKEDKLRYFQQIIEEQSAEISRLQSNRANEGSEMIGLPENDY